MPIVRAMPRHIILISEQPVDIGNTVLPQNTRLAYGAHLGSYIANELRACATTAPGLFFLTNAERCPIAALTELRDMWEKLEPQPGMIWTLHANTDTALLREALVRRRSSARVHLLDGSQNTEAISEIIQSAYAHGGAN